MLFRDAESKLSGCMQAILLELWYEWEELESRISRANETMEKTVADFEAIHRLQSIPGIGIVTDTAVVAAIGNGAAFRKGRDFAAWLGLVPRQHSTEVNNAYSVSANEVMLICGNFWFTVRELYFRAPTASDITLDLGSTIWRSERSGVLVLLPWPTS
jgi:hypothetical protein